MPNPTSNPLCISRIPRRREEPPVCLLSIVARLKLLRLVSRSTLWRWLLLLPLDVSAMIGLALVSVVD